MVWEAWVKYALPEMLAARIVSDMGGFFFRFWILSIFIDLFEYP